MDGVCTYLKGVVSGWCMHLFEGCWCKSMELSRFSVSVFVLKTLGEWLNYSL